MASRKNLLLRIDPDLWAALEVWARDELRSVNGQIEYLLKQAVQAHHREYRSKSLGDNVAGSEPNEPDAS